MATAVISILACSCMGQEYRIEGRLQVETKTRPDAPETNHVSYSVEVVGPRYNIKAWPTEDNARYFECAYADGTMFILHHLQNSKWIDPTGKLSPPGEPPFPAIIDSRSIPPTDGSRAQFVWFAYASAPFFKGLTNTTILPIWDPEDPKTRRQSCEIQMEYSLSPAPPKLPVSVKFLNNGVYNSYNPATHGVDVIPLNPPYDKGFTKASYEVISTTNTAKISLPQAFVFTVYSTPLGSDNVPFERIIIRGWTTAVSDTAPTHAGLPLFKGKASVLDYRIGRQDGTNSLTVPPRYSIHDGKWLTAGDVEKYRKEH
ncbi:MAG TPA: hypothetical protein VN673_05775 [Clostridia bacterium]|nr:hypothetical protein [Clostridia bacterium]